MFGDYQDDMYENVIFPIEDLEKVMQDLCNIFNMEVNLKLPENFQLKTVDFIEIFTTMFKPVNGYYEITDEDISKFMDKLNLRHANACGDLFVKEGYANYAVDTNGEIRLIATQKLKDSKNSVGALKSKNKGNHK